MLKKDYIQRQFEEFGKVLSVILAYKKDKDWSSFELEIVSALNRFTNLEIGSLIEKDQNSFETFIADNPLLKPEQIKIIADLLYEKSFVSGINGNESEMSSILKKAAFLYEFYSRNLTSNEYNLEVHYRIELIRKIILFDIQK